jgi:hypothetical protein
LEICPTISGGLPVTIYRAVNAPLNSKLREVSQKEAVYLKLLIFIIMKTLKFWPKIWV